MTRPLFLFSILTTALVSLAAWGEKATQLPHSSGKTVQDCLWPTERGQRFTVDEMNACLDAHGLSLDPSGAAAASPGVPGSRPRYHGLSLDPPGAEVAGDSGASEAPVWDLPDIREACGAYMEWDPELEDCVRTTVPLPPELEMFEPSGYPMVRPPEGVIVLYPDGTWAEATGCPPELFEETFANNWRFCRDPERLDRIPGMWGPPINGIPYEEAEEIFAEHEAALKALPGVISANLHLQHITVYTKQPGLVPEEVGGIPVKTLPPVYGFHLSHTTSTPLRPLKASANIGSPKSLFEFNEGTLTAIALANGEPWLILPAHLLYDCHNPPTLAAYVMPCPIGNGRRLHECPKDSRARSVWQPWNAGGRSEVVGRVARWDPIPFNSHTPATLDVAAAFADTDTDATNGFLPVSGAIERYGSWSGLEREPNVFSDTNVTIVSGIGSTPENHIIRARVTNTSQEIPYDCRRALGRCGQSCT